VSDISNVVRLGVVETVYLQRPGGQPVSVESRFSRRLLSDEQPYLRQFKVGPEWTLLDRGWLTECSCLVLSNEEGRFHQVQPTPEERDAALRKVVEVGVCFNDDMRDLIYRFAVVRPLESGRFEPADLAAIRIRCLDGPAKVSLTLFPV
jgi:hypothetical protein